MILSEYPFSEHQLAGLIWDVAGELTALHECGKCFGLFLPEHIHPLSDGRFSLWPDNKYTSATTAEATVSLSMFLQEAPVWLPDEEFGAPEEDIRQFGLFLKDIVQPDQRRTGRKSPYSRRLRLLVKACLRPIPNQRLTARQLTQLAQNYLDRRAWEPLPSSSPDRSNLWLPYGWISLLKASVNTGRDWLNGTTELNADPSRQITLVLPLLCAGVLAELALVLPYWPVAWLLFFGLVERAARNTPTYRRSQLADTEKTQRIT